MSSGLFFPRVHCRGAQGLSMCHLYVYTVIFLCILCFMKHFVSASASTYFSAEYKVELRGLIEYLREANVLPSGDVPFDRDWDGAS